MEQSANSQCFKSGEVCNVHTKGPYFPFSQVPDLELIITSTCQAFDVSLPMSYALDLPATYSKELNQALDKDRKEGIAIDTILKYGDKELKVHKCVLIIQSDFFKT